ncbi:hypothetical protein DACRYDRAFT_15030 [Dacryopinax primogenitus]|uniref:Uncharacterized protein n=1 Tax=Dacryopinax primogenitus (strain DJM 731) TaxID=1858805 RepID=M5G4F4_DACPD|nr:uncharacterized protein DACRYDRAFT_15030 [Dacryopinax primogenitus]EJU03115.1 hypothetical protein DACRYDRAFT_15030 [Dacryopinax primogenitus]
MDFHDMRHKKAPSLMGRPQAWTIIEIASVNANVGAITICHLTKVHVSAPHLLAHAIANIYLELEHNQGCWWAKNIASVAFSEPEEEEEEDEDKDKNKDKDKDAEEEDKNEDERR